MPYDLPPKPEPIPIVQNEETKSSSPEISKESKAFIESLEGSKIEPIGMQFFDDKDNICNLTKFTRKDGSSVYITLEHCVRLANSDNLVGIRSIPFKTIVRFSPDLSDHKPSDGLIYYHAADFEKWSNKAQNVVQIVSLKEYMNPIQQKILETISLSNTCEVKDTSQKVLMQTMRRMKELRANQLVTSDGRKNFDNTKVKPLTMYEALSAQPGDSAGFIARVGENINKEVCIKIEGFIQSGNFDTREDFIGIAGDKIMTEILGHPMRYSGEDGEIANQEDVKILQQKLRMTEVDPLTIGKKYIFEIAKTLQDNGYFDQNSGLLKRFVKKVNMYKLDGKTIHAERKQSLEVNTHKGKINFSIPSFVFRNGIIDEAVYPSSSNKTGL